MGFGDCEDCVLGDVWLIDGYCIGGCGGCFCELLCCEQWVWMQSDDVEYECCVLCYE